MILISANQLVRDISSNFFNFSLDLDWEPEKENPFAMLFNQDFQLHGNDTLPTDIVGVGVLCRQLSTS